MTNSALKGVEVFVWDLDGTLHWSPKTANLMRQTFIKMIAQNRNLSFEKSEKIFNKKGQSLSWSKTVALLTNTSEWQVIMNLEKSIDRTPYIEKDTKLLNLFKKLKQFRHLLLTNASYENAFSTLKLLGFPIDHDYPIIKNSEIYPFEKIFSLDKTKTFKPERKMFQHVLSYTKLPPHCHLVIGDSLQNDILPARELNFQTCLIGGKKTTTTNYHFRSIYELASLFSPKYQVKMKINSFTKKIVRLLEYKSAS